MYPQGTFFQNSMFSLNLNVLSLHSSQSLKICICILQIFLVINLHMDKCLDQMLKKCSMRGLGVQATLRTAFRELQQQKKAVETELQVK